MENEMTDNEIHHLMTQTGCGGTLTPAVRRFAQACFELGVAAEREPLTDEQIERGREATFSTSNPFCPCDSKTMRKAVRWAEHAHGIKA